MEYAKERLGKTGIGSSTRRMKEPDEGQERLVAAMEADETIPCMTSSADTLVLDTASAAE